MKGSPNKLALCVGCILLTATCAFGQAVRVATAPSGMVWISGGEFSMGAGTNGHGTDKMPMLSNDAQPVHHVRRQLQTSASKN